TSRSSFARVLLVLAVLFCLAGFGEWGPHDPLGILFLGAPVLAALVLLWGRGLAVAFPLPVLGLLLLIPSVGPVLYVFDGIALLFGLAALYATLRSAHREAWDIRMPGILAVGAVLIPFLALPHVVSVYSFFGSYKQILAEVAVFFGLRRTVKPGSSKFLLFIYPLTGAAAALQLLQRTRGFGFKVYTDLTGRSIFTDLGWGKSNFIAALIVVCIGGSLLLGLLDKRAWVRALVASSMVIMLTAFFLLLSRAATIAVVIMVAILLIAW